MIYPLLGLMGEFNRRVESNAGSRETENVYRPDSHVGKVDETIKITEAFSISWTIEQ